MRFFLIILSFLIILGLSSSVIYLHYTQKKSRIIQTSNQEYIQEGETSNLKDTDTPEEKIETKQDVVREKIERIKKRLALKGLIIEGDSYFRNDQLALALKKYLEFYKKNPDDFLIHEKIGDTYFEMKKYGSALNYYKKITSPKDDIQRQKALSLFYTTDLSLKEERGELQNKLGEIGLGEEQLFYYTTSLSCADNFHMCKLAFQEYFWPEDTQANTSQIEFEELLHIKEAIENYRNFQIDQVYLKNAYIIGAWYGDKMYNLAIQLGEELLIEKPGYKPILQIIAQSHFELGEYETARDTLAKYYQEDDDDPNVTYMLGVINTKLREYVLANIYLQKTIKLGYERSLLARRQLIFNLYTLGNDESMLKEFEKLTQEEETFEIQDLRLAIYYHILHEKYDVALGLSKKGQNIFPESADFYAYEGWIQREQGNTTTAQSILNAGMGVDESNPFLLINIAYNERELGNNSVALLLFRNIVNIFPESEFSIQAEKEIKTLLDTL